MITPEQRAALDELIPPDQQTGDLDVDLAAAAAESYRRRQVNSVLGGAVLGALRQRAGSWRAVERLTGVPRVTAQRWGTPPPAQRGKGK